MHLKQNVSKPKRLEKLFLRMAQFRPKLCKELYQIHTENV